MSNHLPNKMKSFLALTNNIQSNYQLKTNNLTQYKKLILILHNNLSQFPQSHKMKNLLSKIIKPPLLQLKLQKCSYNPDKKLKLNLNKPKSKSHNSLKIFKILNPRHSPSKTYPKSPKQPPTSTQFPRLSAHFPPFKPRTLIPT